MRYLPILFSGAMVLAILDGSKTQTRRGINPQPFVDEQGNLIWARHKGVNVNFGQGLGRGGPNFESLLKYCPYGGPGDRLWVREEHYRFGHWEAMPGKKTKGGRQKWQFVADSEEVLYEAPAAFRKGRHHKDPATQAWHKRLARFMPRIASRITLEVGRIRIARLQNIGQEDARAEGIKSELKEWAEGCGGTCWADYLNPGEWFTDPVPSFESLWRKINGPDSWGTNDWVWVVEFKHVPANSPQVSLPA